MVLVASFDASKIKQLSQNLLTPSQKRHSHLITASGLGKNPLNLFIPPNWLFTIKLDEACWHMLVRASMCAFSHMVKQMLGRHTQ